MPDDSYLWASLIDRAAGVIAERGLLGSRLGSLTREFGKPALFGLKNALENLSKGQKITLCADLGRVYRGRRDELLAGAAKPRDFMPGSPVFRILQHAAAHILPLTIDVDSLAHPQVVTDPLRLNQILVNTVGNAVKFTPAGGLVTVTLTELPDAPRGFGSYRMTVSDTGCGMTPEFLDRIFLPFERDGLGYANKTEGTGLGMTITKSLVDLMGGEIAVESVVGRGSTFAITLPLRVADADELAEAREKAEAAERCQRDFTGCKVLVVDDDDLSREILVEILKDYGFKPEEARDGDAAVRKVASVEPFYYDAVLMDMRMPRMDGDEATREIRALDRPDAATLPIIAETADAFEEGQRRARDAGMTALTTKPLNIHELVALLAEHIPEK